MILGPDGRPSCGWIMIRKIQKQVEEWQDKNFPNLTAEDNLIGVMEELGELSHANLKGRQLNQPLMIEEADAVGDILIFLMGYCNKRSFDMEKIIRRTWNEVKQRDYTEEGGKREMS